MNRTLRFIYLPLIFVAVTASCNKDDADGKEYCVECTMKETNIIGDSDPVVYTMTTENCGWNEQVLDAYLKSGNSTITSNNGGTTIIIRYETSCNKK